MVRNPENMNNIQLTIETLDGEVYAKRDTTSQPFGQTEQVVAFWDNKNVVTIPMHQVKKVIMHFE